MDLPRFLPPHHHHSSRYASLPPPPPPPPPPSAPRPRFPDNSIFHSPHNHHLPQPQPQPQHIPTLPPSFQSSLPPHPPPPPPPPQQHHHYYNPTQSQFPVSYAHPLQDFAQSHRIEDRPRHRLPEPDHSRRVDTWDPSRVLPDAHRPAARPYHPPLDFDLDRIDGHQHQRLFDRPVSKFRHDSQGTSRVRVEFSGGFDPKQKDDNLVWGHGDENYHRRGNFLSDSDSVRRDFFGFVSTSRDVESKLVGYDHRHGSVRDNEAYRSFRIGGGHDGQASRDIGDLLYEMGSNETGDCDGVRIGSAKREYYGLEVGRYDHNRGNREGSHEYNRTPRKQVQKKSAFLRIQMAKPNNRNRESEQLHYSGYFDKGNFGSFRGKDQSVYLDHGMEEEEEDEREESPVELDVSFKSNSLVAKAIVVPSGSAVVSDMNLIPRNEKIRKVSDGDCSNSQLNKLSEGTVNLDSSTWVANKASNSEKDLKHQEEKVMTSDIGNVCDGSSQSCSRRTSVSVGNSKVERSPKVLVSDKDGTNVGSGKTTAPKFVKKKKIVKKVVKKVMNPQSRLSSTQQTKKCDETAKADCSTHSPPAAPNSGKGVPLLEQIVTSDGMTSRHNVALKPCLDKVNGLPENDIADRSPVTAVSHDCGINVESGRVCVTKIKRNWKNSTSVLGSLSCEENRINESPVNADNSVHSLHSISNFDNDFKPRNEITFYEIGHVKDVSKQLNHNVLSISLENEAEKEATETVLSLEDNVNSRLLSSEETKIHEDISNTYSSPHDANNKLGFENCTDKSQENITASDIGIMDTIKKQPCIDQFSTSLENSIPEGIHPALIGSSAIVSLSSSEKTKIQKDLVYAECSNHGRDTWNSDNGCCSSLEEKYTVCNSGTINYTGKHPSTGRVAISLENYAKERYPNDMVTVGASEGNTHKIKKRRKRRTQLDFSNSTNIHTDPVNDVVSPANALDATLGFSLKDLSPAEAPVSGVGSLDIGLLPGTDGISALHANSLADGFSEVKLTMNSDVNSYLDGNSPRYKKNREVSATDSPSSRPTVSETNERPTGTSISCAEVSLTKNDDRTQPEEVAVSSIHNLPCPHGITVLLDNTLGARSSEAVGETRDVYTDDGLKLLQLGVESFSNAEDPNAQSPCPSGLGSEQKENSTPLMVVDINQNDTMDIETSDGEKMDAQALEDQVLIHGETPLHKITSEPLFPDLDQRFSSTDIESDYVLVKDDLPSVSNNPSFSDDGAGFSSPNTNDEVMESMSRTLLGVGSPETLSEVPSIVMLNGKASPSQISNDKVCGDDQKLNQKFVEDGSGVCAHTPFPQYTKRDRATESDHSVMGKTVLLPSQDSKITSCRPNLMSAELIVKRRQTGPSIPRAFPSRSSFVLTNSNKTGSSARIAKPRTWHRTGPAPPLPVNKPFTNNIPPKRQLVENNMKYQSTSYIRKGNSLVRNPAPAAAQQHSSHGLSSSVYRGHSSGTDESKKSTGFDSRADVTDPQNLLRLGMHTPLERPRTPPLPSGTKISTGTDISSGDNTSSPLAESPFSGCCETTSDPMKFTEFNNVPESAEDPLKISENLSGTSNNLESKAELSDGNAASVNMKRIIYIKRKSNQLVATSNPCDLSVHNGNNIQATSDGYYKRRKNQLIRASLENQIKKSVSMPDDLLNSGGQRVPKVVSSRKFSKRRLHKVVAKTCKPVKSSLVWTLCGMQSLKNDCDTSDHQQVLPYRFPWKRATYGRSFMHNQISSSNNSSLSMISRKLLLLRQRDTVYTRSINGFSLRKFKVFSVGGSSLKWSKSIEKNSKKANEEATLAVAAVEKKKREQNGAACGSSQTKNRNHSSRDRIFRVGSVRYKMDSTKRTLQRISDDESTCSTSPQPEKDAKKSYIPRRLVIGNDEYVRIGNGNQLIRDPKKRTRILASEKVRWSLHTARLRLAKKRTYCQFFTRFGKCNKDDGKCPYIHDPSKIAVCTKFLNGLCFNPNCKLTHKVIPERMPDCSYFLQGLCTNRNCPYRHVNVNPKASTCEGFLRGYCANGNECRKKHSYVCPIFKATGTCPQGSKCKLHHPKSRSKGKKRKRSGEQKNARGRYFGSIHINVSEPRTAVHEKHTTQNNDEIFLEGKSADYINLDVSDEEVGESNDRTSEQTFCDSDPLDEQLDDLDELIKPVRIMINLTT